MFKKIPLIELAILIATIAIIFLSEFYYIVLKDHDRAIFIGLWPPTMIGLLIYLNLRKNQA
nr:hypothetical protein [Pseudopedobacter sp.]